MYYKGLLKAILKKDFSSFIHKVFNTINPGVNFSNNWHIDLLADYLSGIDSLNTNRLIINIPPRCLKSVCISVAWPIWLLGLDPAKKIIAASYSQALSLKHSVDCRAILTSSWYKQLFPKTILSANQKNKFTTTEFGFRFATSVGGTITGEGADVLIIDDPHNPTHIHSNKIRLKTINWYKQTFVTRLNNPNKGLIVIIMQRLHHNDLCGYLMENEPENWSIIKIPARTQTNIAFNVADKKYTFDESQTIDSTRLSKKTLDKIEKEVGAYNFLAQYMQNPPQEDLGLLSINDITFCSQIPLSFESIIQSWDTAIKISQTSDFSACTTWGIYQSNYYLIDCFYKKLEYSDLKNNVKKLFSKWKPKYLLIEDKANGQSLIQDLKIEGFCNILPQKPKLDKVHRFAIVTSFFVTGQVLLSKNIDSYAIEQITNFPHANNDDIVDSISQFLNYIKQEQQKKRSIKIRSL